MNKSIQPLRNEPMSAHTSWRIGGTADLFYKPASVDELSEFLAAQDAKTDIHWVGLGSNLLVRDGGIRGLVICTLDLPARISRTGKSEVKIGAGVPCTLLARQCMRWKLGPAEFFAGIPGTFGGALAMNAGAFGGETWDCVETVQTIDRTGTVFNRNATDFKVGYRSVSNPFNEWYLSATLKFEEDREADSSNISKLMQMRGSKQPLGKRSCGSVFRNPDSSFAAELIGAAGLKGTRIGGAVVSEKHSNFIINTGGASADDVERLIHFVRDKVAAQSGVILELEVQILGEKIE
ncbi:MAG: UDP-N-acetylenolpyruvoylglucosamine reductase [Rhodospirillaceae bacterium]|nr:UDP-N-acetylenolpyruvoylglucosamine reductase [Rhodospirillaceae bacterium]